MAGYHLTPILKGTLGQFSKVEEEFNEFLDAINQNCTVMALLELSDLLGAAQLYYESHNQTSLLEKKLHDIYKYNLRNKLSNSLIQLKISFSELQKDPLDYSLWSNFLWVINHYAANYNLNIHDLQNMSNITKRAFVSGERI
jgi:hypothetical protein